MPRPQDVKWVEDWLQENNLQIGNFKEYSVRVLWFEDHVTIEYADDNGWSLFAPDDTPEKYLPKVELSSNGERGRS